MSATAGAAAERAVGNPAPALHPVTAAPARGLFARTASVVLVPDDGETVLLGGKKKKELIAEL